MCLEHFSSTINPPAVTTCAELVMCVRNMLATYEELWMLEWREQLESMMTGYFERSQRGMSWSSFTNCSEQRNNPRWVWCLQDVPGLWCCGGGLHQGVIPAILRCGIQDGKLVGVGTEEG